MTTIDYSDERTPRQIALALCRGSYQRGIVTGDQRYSGADLCGRASNYIGRYRRSRDAILARMKRAGVPYRIDQGKHGRLTLVIADKFPWA